MPRTHDPKKIREVVKQIRSVDDLGPYVKVLVYGVNGSGKTRFAASAPNCLIIDINERGTRSAVGTGSDVMEVEDWETLGSLYWHLKSGDHEYDSVAIDTLTAMQAMAMSFVLQEKEDRDPSAEKDMPDKRSYGKAGQLMSSMIWAFRNLDMHVIFTAQVRQEKDQDTGEILDITVDLPNSSRGAATGAVSVLGYMSSQEQKVRKEVNGRMRNTTQWVDTMLVGPHREFSPLKDRTNQLGPKLIRPTMPKVIKAWKTTAKESE